MDERELIDHLHQLWSKTTHADKGEWKITKDDKSILVDIESEDQDGWEQTISFGTYEYDAEFITAVHAAMPTLSRLFHTAWDEADRLNEERDSRECRIAELEMEISEAKYVNSQLRNDFAEELASVAALQIEVESYKEALMFQDARVKELEADLEGYIAG